MANDIEVGLKLLVEANTKALDGINQSIKQLNSNVSKLARGNRAAADSTAGLAKQQNLLHGIYIKNSATINRQYLTSVGGLRRAYRALGDEFDRTFVITKNGAKSLNDTGMAWARLGIKADLFSKTVNNMSKNLVNMGKNAQWTGRQLMVGVTVPLIGMSAAAIKSFTELDQQLLRTRKLLAGNFGNAKANRDMQELTQQTYKLSESFGRFTAVDISKVQNIFASIGSGKEQVKQLSDLAVQLDAIGNVNDLTKSAEMVRSLFQTLGGSIPEVRKQLELLNEIDDKTNLNMDDMIDSIPKIFPLLRQFGASASQTGALISGMTQNGFQAVESANALKAAFTKLPAALAMAGTGARGLKQLREFIDKFNADNPKNKIAFFGKDGKALSGIESLKTVAGAYSKMNDMQRATFRALAFGTQQSSRLSAELDALVKSMDPATSAGQDLAKALDIAANSAEDAAGRWARSIGVILGDSSTKLLGQTQKLINQGREMGKKLIPIALQLAQTLNKLVEKIAALPESTQKLIIKFGMLAASMGPVMYAGSQLVILFGQAFRYAFAIPLSALTKVTHRFHKAGEGIEKFHEQLAKLQQEFIEDNNIEKYKKGIDDVILKQEAARKSTESHTAAVEAQTAALKANSGSAVGNIVAGDISDATPKFPGVAVNPNSDEATKAARLFGRGGIYNATPKRRVRDIMSDDFIETTAKNRAAHVLTPQVEAEKALRDHIDSLKYASAHLDEFYKIFDTEANPQALAKFLKMTDDLGMKGQSFAKRLEAVMKSGGIDSLSFITGNGKISADAWEEALANLGAGASKMKLPGGSLTGGSFPQMMAALRGMVVSTNEAPAGKSGIKAPRMLTSNVMDEVFGATLASKVIDIDKNLDIAEETIQKGLGVSKDRKEDSLYKKFKQAVDAEMAKLGYQFEAIHEYTDEDAAIGWAKALEAGTDMDEDTFKKGFKKAFEADMAGRTKRNAKVLRDNKQLLELVAEQVGDEMGINPKKLPAVVKRYISTGTNSSGRTTFSRPKTYANELAGNQFRGQKAQLLAENLGIDFKGMKDAELTAAIQKRTSEVMRDVRKQMGVGQARTKLATKLGVNAEHMSKIMSVATVEGIDRSFLETFDLPKEFWDSVGYRLWGGASKQQVAELIGDSLDANQKSHFNTAVARVAQAIAEDMGMGGVVSGGFATETANGPIKPRRYTSKKLISDLSSMDKVGEHDMPHLAKFIKGGTIEGMREALSKTSKPLLDVIEEALIMEIRDVDLIDEMIAGKGYKGKDRGVIAQMVAAAVSKASANMPTMDEIIGAAPVKATYRKTKARYVTETIESDKTDDYMKKRAQQIADRAKGIYGPILPAPTHKEDEVYSDDGRRLHRTVRPVTGARQANVASEAINDFTRAIEAQLKSLGLTGRQTATGSEELNLPSGTVLPNLNTMREVWVDDDGNIVVPRKIPSTTRRRLVKGETSLTTSRSSNGVRGLSDEFNDFRTPTTHDTTAGRRALKEMPFEPGSNVFATPHGLKEFDEIDRITDAVAGGRKALDLQIEALSSELHEGMAALSAMERNLIETQIAELTKKRGLLEAGEAIDDAHFAKQNAYRSTRDATIGNVKRSDRFRRKKNKLGLGDEVFAAITELADETPGIPASRKQILGKLGRKTLGSKIKSAPGRVLKSGFGVGTAGKFLKNGGGVAAMIPGAQELGSVLSFVGPLLPIILAIAGAVLLIWKNWKKVSEGLKSGAKRFGDGLAQLKQAVGNVIAAIIGPFETMWDRVNGKGDESGKKFTKMWQNVGRVLNILFQTIAALLNFLTPLIKMFAVTIASSFEIFINVIRGVIALLSGDFSGVWDSIKSIVSAAMEGIRAIFGDVIAVIIKGLLMLPKTVATAMIGIMSFFGKIKGPLGAPFRAAADNIKDAKGELEKLENSATDWLTQGGDYDKNKNVNVQQIQDIKNAVDSMRKQALKAGASDSEANKIAKAYKKALEDALAHGFNMTMAKDKAAQATKKMMDGIKSEVQDPANTPTVPPPNTEDFSGAGAEAGNDFMSALKSKVNEMQSKWKDAVMDAFEEWADAQVKSLEDAADAQKDSIDEQIKAIDDLSKAEQEAQYQREALQKRQDMADQRKHNALVYGRDRDKALYEGRVDDAKELEIERTDQIKGEKKDEEDFNTDYNNHMVDLERDRKKEELDEQKKGIEKQLQVEKDAKEKMIKLRREQLESMLDQFNEMTPRSAEAARELQAKMLGALGEATDGYGAIGEMQAKRWADSWQAAVMRAKAQMLEDAYWASAAGANDIANGDNNSATAGAGSSAPGASTTAPKAPTGTTKTTTGSTVGGPGNVTGGGLQNTPIKSTDNQLNLGPAGSNVGAGSLGGEGNVGAGGLGGSGTITAGDLGNVDTKLRVPATPDEVRQAQTYLSTMGYDTPVDGIYGDKTKVAIFSYNSEPWVQNEALYINRSTSPWNVTDLGYQTIASGNERFRKYFDVIKFLGAQSPLGTTGGGNWSTGGGGSQHRVMHSGGSVDGEGDIPAVLQGGEYVINRKAVKSLGLQFLEKLNAAHVGPQGRNMVSSLANRVGSLRKFHMGGLVAAAGLTSGAPNVSGAGGGGFELNLHFDGGFFGTDREIEKLADTIEKRIAPKFSRAKGFEQRKINSI